jgi:hypothetical protein
MAQISQILYIARALAGRAGLFAEPIDPTSKKIWGITTGTQQGPRRARLRTTHWWQPPALCVPLPVGLTERGRAKRNAHTHGKNRKHTQKPELKPTAK